MASVKTYVEEIKSAVRGEEVRGSIVNAILAMNDESSSSASASKEAQSSASASAKSAQTAATNATNANTAAQEAKTSASSSATSATNANAAAQEAKTSAAASAISATNANTAAQEAKTSASTSAQSAQASATVAERLNNDLNENLKTGVSVDDLYDSSGNVITDSSGNNVKGRYIFVSIADFNNFQNDETLQLNETTKTAKEALETSRAADALSKTIDENLKTGVHIDNLLDSNGNRILDNRSNEIYSRLIFVEYSTFANFCQRISTEINMMLQDIAKLKSHALLDNNY